MIKFLSRILALATCAATLWGQSETPSVEGGQKQPPTRVRAFLLPTTGQGEVKLTARTDTTETPILLGAARDIRVINEGYTDLKDGTWAFELKSGEKMLGNQAVRLNPGRYYSIAAWETAQGWQMKIFADGPVPPNAGDRPMRLLSALPKREALVSLNSAPETKVSTESIQEVRLPAKEVGIALRVLAPDGGAPYQTSTGMDLSQSDSAYVIVAPDYRGKPDTLIVPGGPGPAPSQEAMAAVPAPSPPSPEDLRNQRAGLVRLELEYRQAQIEALKATEAGPNKIANADEIRRELEKQIGALRQKEKEATTPAAPR